MDKKLKLTKTAVERLPFLNFGQHLCWDSEIKGFGLRVGKSTKTYIVQKKIKGKAIRVSLGIHGQITTEEARKLALKRLGEMTQGKNPTLEKKLERIRNVTLKDAFADFILARKNLKNRTKLDYQRVIDRYFKDWQNRQLMDITPDMVKKRHSWVGEGNGGKAQADGAMRVLRAVYNFAIGEYEDGKGHPVVTVNPVKKLSQTRAWYNVGKRTSVVKIHQLFDFFEAVEKLKETSVSSKAETARDYILLILFTGLRRQEAAKLMWDDVDFKAKTLTVTDTKNKQPLTLPLSDFLLELLTQRYENRSGGFVFPGAGVGGYLVEPKRQINKIREWSGIEFTLHDLRRTFITIAEGLDIPHYALKRLVNHKLSGDVTAGYIIMDAERLRKPMQTITDSILKSAGRKQKTKLIKIYSGVHTNFKG